MYVKELTNQEFESFTNSYSVGSIFQTKEYAFVMNHQGYTSQFIGLIDNNKIIAATLLIIEKHHGYNYAYAPRGFLVNYNNKDLFQIFNEKLKKFLGDKGIAAIKLSPIIVKKIYSSNKNTFYENEYYDEIYSNIKKLDYHHYGYNNFFEAQRPRFEAIINLNRNEKELFSNISKSYRSKIKSAYKNGIYIEKGNIDDVDLLYDQVKNKYSRNKKYLEDMYNYFDSNGKVDLFIAKLDTKKYLVNRKNKYEAMENIVQNINVKITTKKNNYRLINNKLQTDATLSKYKSKLINATKLIEQYPEGINLASIMVVKDKNQVHMIIDGYDKNFKDLNAKHLLLWELIKKYSSEGFKIFNLGGVSNILLENNKYSGLNDFKTNFGAYFVEYMGDLEVITNNTLYIMHNNPIKRLIKKAS